MRNLTNEEQQQLLKYLSPVDTVIVPDRLASFLSYNLNVLSFFTT